ncbi:MAG: hypothetical protein P4L92_23650 [Rudaea sp.]|nr:hypothetical protein [Rudaea sp.]
MPLRAHIAALVLALFCGPALGADIIGYGEAFNNVSGDTLYRVDLTAHTAQELGSAGFLNGQQPMVNLEGLTYSPGGQLYAVSDALKVLLRVNPLTGTATLVGPLNLAGQSVTQRLDLGLAFTCDGRLWLSAGNGNFWQVDPATGATAPVGNLGAKITGIAANGNQVYGAGSQGNNNLYLIDTATAQATAIGAYGSGASYVTTASPGFDASGQLWAILDYVPPEPGVTTVALWSDLAQLNATTGTLVDTGPIVGPSDLEQIGLKGLAIAPPVCTAARPGDPTPSMSAHGLTLLTLLLLLLAGTVLRRRRPTL